MYEQFRAVLFHRSDTLCAKSASPDRTRDQNQEEQTLSDVHVCQSLPTVHRDNPAIIPLPTTASLPYLAHCLTEQPK